MREIKFRTWDGAGMVEVWELTIYESGNGYRINDQVDSSYDKWPLMQYTGLKDKNGREIYEGDIVKRNPPELNRLSLHDFQNWIIYFGSWCYMRRPVNNENGFAFDVIDARSNCEIIGNIYETPELVNQ
jgi:uncharacterized phage protein (TIGR01671 family)